MKISKICLSRIPKPWTACQFGGKKPLNFTTLFTLLYCQLCFFFKGTRNTKKGKQLFPLLWLLWQEQEKGAACRLQEKLYKLNNSIPLFTLLYCQLCFFFKGNRNTRLLERQFLGSTVFLISCFRNLDHNSL